MPSPPSLYLCLSLSRAVSVSLCGCVFCIIMPAFAYSTSAGFSSLLGCYVPQQLILTGWRYPFRSQPQHSYKLASVANLAPAATWPVDCMHCTCLLPLPPAPLRNAGISRSSIYPMFHSPGFIFFSLFFALPAVCAHIEIWHFHSILQATIAVAMATKKEKKNVSEGEVE